MKNDTIAAIATPLGTGGISIIKVSGPEAIAAASLFFRPSNPKRALTESPSQTMRYGHIWDMNRDMAIDEVLVTVLRGPHSFTGEDVVEINCHGGPQVTRTVLEMLLGGGLRLADPGEFTRRAFMNGRIDLTQVEATIDLIHARTRRAARLGSRMLTDGLGHPIKRILARVGDMRVRIEAAIDFGEEDGTDLSAQEIQNGIRHGLPPPVQQLIAAYQQGEWVRHGLRVVLAGKPNVGKSSLMNQLLNRERVIVTDIPGTTRDTVEEGFDIEGVPIRLTDTAGLRSSQDPVERIGQAMAEQAMEQADLILFMIDGSQPVDAADRAIAEKLGHQPHLVLRNKSDLVPDPGERARLDPPPTGGYLDISALHGEGLERLKAQILLRAGVEPRMETEACLPNLRQKNLLAQARDVLTDALASDSGLDTLAIDLRDCERYLNQILGIEVEQDVLDEIFQRFCIGK